MCIVDIFRVVYLLSYLDETNTAFGRVSPRAVGASGWTCRHTFTWDPVGRGRQEEHANRKFYHITENKNVGPLSLLYTFRLYT